MKTEKLFPLILIFLLGCSSVFEKKENTAEDIIGQSENRENDIPQSISLADFKKSVEGKSKNQIKEMYGNPCQANEYAGTKLWYYGRICSGNSKRIKIINEDTGDEVSMVQIQFYDTIAHSINTY